jgi:PKD repeat protein
MSSSLVVSLLSVIGVTLAIASVLLPSNFTIINAQQLEQELTSQPGEINNGTILFQNIGDGFRVQVPEGWVIYDVNNTGSTRSEESRQGYGILAQLCTQEQEQQATAVPSNVSRSGDTASCQGTEEDIIHIIRYPDLETGLQAATNNVSSTNNNNMTIDNIFLYHLQKLEQVGYRGIGIVNSTDTTLSVINAQTNQTIASIPAKNVQMTYNTSITPNETRTGYFLLTATNETSPSVGMTKGYSIFYEGPSAATTAETITTAPSGSLAPRPLPTPVRQVFDSFELVTEVPTAGEEPPPTEEPFTVEIVSTSTEGVALATLLFETDTQGGTEPYTYSWNFGDGSEEVIDEDAVTSHTFEQAGTYNVVLTITDAGGRTASDSVAITITGGEEEEPPATTAEGEEAVEEQQPPEDGDGEDLLVCIRGGGPPREAELTLEEIERSLELGLVERITIGPCPPAD